MHPGPSQPQPQQQPVLAQNYTGEKSGISGPGNHPIGRAGDEEEAEEQIFNILPLHDMLADNEIVRFPEVRAARAALQAVGGLSRPKGWRQGMDLLDWLALLFGFQSGSVQNQREHLVMLLANYQMRMQPPPDPIDQMNGQMVEKLRLKVLDNYLNWCSFLGKASNLWLSSKNDQQEQRQLLYIALYLLIWGEAANLRFMPECLCFLFHNMAGEMNKILEHKLGDSHSEFMPSYTGDKAFLLRVVTPLYNLVKAEAAASQNGAKPHSAWRNYDDINEFFWSQRCFTQLSWPMNPSCSFMSFISSKGTGHKVGKTGFVEQRSFWSIYRSFDHLWIGHIILLQAMIILAFSDYQSAPWNLLRDRDVLAQALSIFITWAGLRLIQSLLDLLMQFHLISWDTILIGVRLFAKVIAAAIWTTVFRVLYSNAWQKRHNVGSWSGDANTAFRQLVAAVAFFVSPEMLAVILYLMPWIGNYVEKSNAKISRALIWWFQSRCFVGRGLGRGLWDTTKYTLFWLAVLLTKFSFSYFLQIRPLVEPTRQLLELQDVIYSWYEFWGQKSNRTAIIALWAPVVLVYLMDLQIWYTVFSSLAGSLVGLLEHIGEIRNLEQLKLRFPFFASAISFSITPEESLLKIGQWGYRSWFRNFMQRVKLRHGFGAEHRKFSPGSLEAERFSFLWNSIISTFREEDILSDLEVQLLEFLSPAWNITVAQWPCILLSNELWLALEQVKKWQGSDDKQLWRKISKSEYRRCAVLECYQSIRHVLQRIIRENSKEWQMVDDILSGMQSSLANGTFLQNYLLRQIPAVHKLVLDLINTLLDEKLGPKKMFDKVVQALQNLYEAVHHDLRSENHALGQQGPADKLLFTDTVELPNPRDAVFFRRLKRLRIILATQHVMGDVPKNLEARRRLAFFGNSLFMNLPKAPPVERMLGFSVLTPYYEEAVLYSKSSLKKQTKDGLSVLMYLQQIFPDEWANFKERMASKNGVQHDDELWKLDNAMELRLWASYRGQTLARTVRGMMYYQKALKVLAYLDGASEMEMRAGRELHAASTFNTMQMFAMPSIPSASITQHDWVLNRTASGIRGLLKEAQQEAVASMKFTYMVTCQLYGQQKAKNNPVAKDILFLMKKYKALRIAYVDEIASKYGKQHFSVLVKYDPLLEREVEIFRVQLPGPVKVGEGKPENQNHALIFTRGDALQTIDMNQDNYFEETLKMRNLLQEFIVRHGLRRPQILGVREHVFTGTVSSLASFMSAQETSFVTLGQRVLANPLKVRMHYGHPDVFDRLWFAVRGGISKASSKINVSEDIYAGFSCTLRGGNVTHHEYIQAGKGRDLGLTQIAIFESKVAGGNGEQVLSRDVHRLGHSLDFFRMLSFYYTTVGFFISNMLVVLTVYAFMWGRVYLALSGLEKNVTTQSAFTSRALTASLNQQFIVQLGVFTALPMIVENSIEHGFRSAAWDFIIMQMQLASVFFTFSLGTRAHYFGRTILHGGAGYRATGRGFVLKHEKFYKTYMLFARSHFVKGVELIVLLVIYGSFGDAAAASTSAYMLISLSTWFLALSWVLGPFLFNTLGFDSMKLSQDFDDFWDWMWDDKVIKYKDPTQEEEETWAKFTANPKRGWHIWWEKEHEHLKNTGFWGSVLEIFLNLRFLFLQYGVVYQLNIAKQHKTILVYILSWVYMAVLAIIYMILYFAAKRFSMKKHLYYRLVQALAAVFVVVVIVVLMTKTTFKIEDLLLSTLAFVPAGWGLLSIALVFRRFLEPTPLWQVLVSVARMFDLGAGVLIFIPLVILSWIPGFQDMQNRILFNQAFSRGLNITRLLTAHKPQYQEDSDKEQ